MQTEKQVLDKPAPECVSVYSLVDLRTMPEDKWIEQYGSTTVRKAKRLGGKFKQQYYIERVAFEFGYHWKMIPASRVVFGDVMSEGDCHQLTEAIWLSDCYLAKQVFVLDQFQFKYIIVTNQDDSVTEGVGLICRQLTNCSWIPDGQILYWIQAEYDKAKGEYKENINP